MSKFGLWLRSLPYLPRRVVLSTAAVIRLLYFKPQYVLLAAVVSIVFYELVFWMLNIGLAHYLLTTPFLTFTDKLQVAVSGYTGIFSYPFSGLAITLFAVSVLQGVAIAVLFYLSRAGRSAARGIGGTGITGVLSVFGLGCAACGTSLVTPVLTFLFSSSSALLADTIGFYSALVALAAAVVTVHLAGLKLAMVSRM